MLKILSSSCCALLLAATGCIVERDYAPLDQRGDPFAFDTDARNGGYDAATLPVQEGRVQGDIGAVRNFDARTDSVQAYGDGNWMSINLTAYDDRDRMGMVILDITDLDLRTAPAGTYRYDAQGFDGPAGSVYVTGCSSDSEDFYDAPASEAVVVIEDRPTGEREVTVDAVLPNGNEDTTATGSFVLER